MVASDLNVQTYLEGTPEEGIKGKGMGMVTGRDIRGGEGIRRE